MSTDPDTRQLYTELGYLRGAMSTMKDAILSHEEGLHDLQAERDRLRAENAELRAASDHRKVNKWDGLCADVGIDPDSTISTVREAIEREAKIDWSSFASVAEGKGWVEGDDFPCCGTPPRLTVHKLNVAPVGSVVANHRGVGWRKLSDGRWVGALGLRKMTSTEVLMTTDDDATIAYPEDQR